MAVTSRRPLGVCRRCAVLTVLAWTGACGIVYDINIQPKVGVLEVERPIRATAALVITKETREYTYYASPQGRSDYTVSFPVGAALEKASVDVFSQVFPGLRVLESEAESDRFDLVFGLDIGELKYQWAYPDKHTTRVSVRMTVSKGAKHLWSRHYQAKERTTGVTKGGDWQSQTGQTVAEGLVEILKLAVADLTSDPVLQPMIAAIEKGEEPELGQIARQSDPARKPEAGAVQTDRFPRRPFAFHFRGGKPRADDVAVIIGNADYGRMGKDIPDVVPAYADAEGFKRYAIEALGVREGNVIDLRDATGAQLFRVFGTDRNPRGQLHDWVRPGQSRVFVYYAGHGAPASGDGSAYLVPSDADAARIGLNGYSLEVLYRNLGQVSAETVTVVLEACFSGASQAGSVISNASPVFLKPKATKVPANVTVIAAGAADQIASWEEDKSHGLFTKYFLKGMAGEADAAPYGNGDGTVGMDEIDRYLKDTLTYYARRYYGRDQTAQIVTGGKTQ